jgi:4-amino-4-deoxy-L-arabinose transferase-like glycosyltransferase
MWSSCRLPARDSSAPSRQCHASGGLLTSLLQRQHPAIPILVFLYGTLAALAFIFLVYHRQTMIVATVDLNGFGHIARNIAEGHGFSSGLGPTIRRGPLYPYFGAALLKLFGSDGASLNEAQLYRPILIGNAVIFGLTCLTVWWTARRLFGATTALFAAAITPLVPQSMRYIGMTEAETLMGLFTVLLAAVGLVFAKNATVKSGAALGAVAGLATLTKPIVLLFPFGFVVLVWLFSWRKLRPDRQQILATISLFGVFIALLVPWSIRNAIVTNGEFKGISSNAPAEFLRGYIHAQPKYYLLRQDFGGGDPSKEQWDPEANAYEEKLLQAHGANFYREQRDEFGNRSLNPKPAPGLTSADLELERDRIEKVEMKRKLLHEPGAFLRKFGVQLATFWYIVETRTKSLLVGGIALVVLALSAIGYASAHRRREIVWPIAIVVLYFNAIYAAFLAFARYSMPLYPTLTILMAGGIAAIAASIFKRAR